MSEERFKSSNEKFCHSCGSTINKEAEICPKCGVRVKSAPSMFGGSGVSGSSSRQRIVFVILGIFLGEIGIHNFYAGYNSKGIAQLIIAVTLGWIFGLGLLITWIWSLIEIITVTVDANGQLMG